MRRSRSIQVPRRRVRRLHPERFFGSRNVTAAGPTEVAFADRVPQPEFIEAKGSVDGLPIAARIAYWICMLSDSLTSMMARQPRTTRAIIAAIFAVSVVCKIITHAAHAQVLNSIEITVEDATGAWLGNALALAQLIFVGLAGLVIVTNVVTYYMAFETVRGMFGVVLRSLLNIGIPYAVLQLAPATVGAVIGYAMTISGDITGGTAPPVTPDQVWVEGVNIGWGLVQKAFDVIQQSHFVFSILNPQQMGSDLGYDFMQGAVDIIFLVAAALLCIIMIAAFTFIAVELVMAFLQAYFCLPLGAWALGFMATSSTSNIAMGWWSALLRVMVRFIAVLAVVSFAQNIGMQWQNDIAQIVPNWNQLPQWNGQGQPPAVNIGALKTIISFALGAVALLYIVITLPRLAEAALSGAPVLTGSNAMQVAGAPAIAAATGGTWGALQGARAGWLTSAGGGTAVGTAGAARGAAGGLWSGGIRGPGAQAAQRAARNIANTIDRMGRG